MSLNSFDNVLPRSTSGCDSHFRFRSGVDPVARFTQSSEDEDEEEENEDVVVQLPTWTPPPRTPQQQRSRSFPRRWNPTSGGSGGLRRAVGRLSATSRMLGRRSVLSSSWDGRRALEQALLLAAVVPLKASTDASSAGATSSTVAVDTESEQRGLNNPTDIANIAATCPADTDNDQRSQSESTQNSETIAESDSILLP